MSSPATRWSVLPLLLTLPFAACAQADLGTAPTSIFGDKTELRVGAGVVYAARYAGAANGRAQSVPLVSVQRGMLFADTTRGVGLQYQASTGFYLAQSVFYDLGRLDTDSNWRPGSTRLAGMGNVPGTLTTRTQVAQPVTEWLTLSAEAEFALRDSAGRNRYRTGAEFNAFKNRSDSITVDVDAWWGDQHYNQAYFGVTPQQAARTTLAAFTPRGGRYANAASLNWEHHFSEHWSSNLQLSGLRYAGRVSSSPVVSNRNTASASAFLLYTH